MKANEKNQRRFDLTKDRDRDPRRFDLTKDDIKLRRKVALRRKVQV